MPGSPPTDSASAQMSASPGNDGNDPDGPAGGTSRRSLPRRSKKRANYKEPSEDELEDEEVVPVISKKPRLERVADRDQQAPVYQPNTARQSQPDNEAPRRDTHHDMSYPRPLPRMHLPEDRNFDPRLSQPAPAPHAGMPGYAPPHSYAYDRRPPYGSDQSYMNGGTHHPMEQANPYIFDNRGSHPSPYEQSHGSQSYFHPAPPPPPQAGYHTPPYYSTPPPPPQGPPGPSYGDPYMYTYNPPYSSDGRSQASSSSHYPHPSQRMTASPRPQDVGPGVHRLPPNMDEETMLANSQWTSDAHAKISNFVRRKCFNCGEISTATWRRSTVNPGKVLCNKCGLFERTHHKPRPPSLNEERGGARTRNPRAPPQSYEQPPPMMSTPRPAQYAPTAAPASSVIGSNLSAPPLGGPGGSAGASERPTTKTNGYAQMGPGASSEGNINPNVTLAPLRPSSHQEHRASPTVSMDAAKTPDPATPSRDANLDPRLALDMDNKGRSSDSSIPSLSEMIANVPTNSGDVNGGSRHVPNAAQSASASTSRRGTPVTLPPISTLDAEMPSDS